MPEIETRWLGFKSPGYRLRSSHLEEYPIFKTFNKKYFQQNILPNKRISYRYSPQKTVTGGELKKLIQQLINEIKKGEKEYTHFDVISGIDFNKKTKSGQFILKCKQHPFVVKLFMESPQTFIKHNSKGFKPIFFFYMAGGINRHLLGFTRIKNLENVKKQIENDPYWSTIVTLPRKWFVLPRKTRWIEITGKNIGTKKSQKIAIPSTYCVVSDWINAEKKASIFNKKDRKICMELSNHLGVVIDPHIDNFLIEKDTNKLAIVDTEHFLTVIGMKEKRKFKGYFTWIAYLVGKCAKSMFFRNKKTRKCAQLVKSDLELKY